MSAVWRRTHTVSAQLRMRAGVPPPYLGARNATNQTFPHFYDRRASLLVTQSVEKRLTEPDGRKARKRGKLGGNFGDFWEVTENLNEPSWEHAEIM